MDPEIATEMYRWSDGKMWEDFSVQGPEDDPVWATLQTTLTKVQLVIEANKSPECMRVVSAAVTPGDFAWCSEHNMEVGGPLVLAPAPAVLNGGSPFPRPVGAEEFD